MYVCVCVWLFEEDTDCPHIENEMAIIDFINNAFSKTYIFK